MLYKTQAKSINVLWAMILISLQGSKGETRLPAIIPEVCSFQHNPPQPLFDELNVAA